MTNINGELLALFHAERLREQEACIHAIRQAADEVASMPLNERPTLAQFVTILILRVRSQP